MEFAEAWTGVNPAKILYTGAAFMEKTKVPEAGVEGQKIDQAATTKINVAVLSCPKCKSTKVEADDSVTNTAAVVGGVSGAALAAGGMVKGGVIGSVFGPVGTALGAVAGLLIGSLSGGAAGATVGGVIDRAKRCLKCQECGHIFKA